MISRSMSSVALSFLLLIATSVCHGRLYNTTAGRVEGKMNVHIVPHSHDDAGWLRTFNQYYYGANLFNNDFDKEMGGVQYTLDTAIAALLANPNRRFTYSDMAFFLKWWEEQDDFSQKKVQELVDNGQLDFVNGGYVQHDEAAAHYVAMIDQTTVGHQFLNSTFGFTPTIGWQIDPFGHSGTQASLMTGALGFDAVYFARSDYQDRQLRSNTKELELVWRGAKSYGSSADVLSGSFPSGDYNPPDRFMWEWGFESWKNSEPIVDCDDCGEWNVKPRVDDFVNGCMMRFNITQGDDVSGGSDIMITMGTDFTYANAFVWYKNIDKLIHYANEDGRMNLFYSTPATYTAAKHSYNRSWPLKTDDFFPYADNEFSYWTGYFTSRPTSKGYVRTCTSFLQAARQMEVLSAAARAARRAVDAATVFLRGAKIQPVAELAARYGAATAAAAAEAAAKDVADANKSSSSRLELAVALLQHHDAITGTARQDVADDYHFRLSAGMAEAEEAFNTDLASLVFADEADKALNPASKWNQTQPSTNIQAAESASLADREGTLGMCPFLNASVCHPTMEMSRLGHSIVVAVYNPLAWPRTEGVRVPLDLSFTSQWTVVTGTGGAVDSQLVPVSNATLTLQSYMVQEHILADLSAAAAYEIAFLAEVPPLGYSTYTISPAQSGQAGSYHPAARTLVSSWANSTKGDSGRRETQATVSVSSGAVTLTVSPHTGRILSLSRNSDGVATQLNTEMMYYNSSDSYWPRHIADGKPEASGAYIFRPNQEAHQTAVIPIQIVEGPILTEIRQEWQPWATLTTRVWKDSEHIESEWTVGPLPFEDKLGREVVVRFETNVTSGDEFYTDSNGREMLKRKLNFRPSWNLDVKQPVAGNYYPVTAAIYIEEEAGRQLAVVTDRAQGGSSLHPGQVELMVHRRMFHDDGRGVSENLNETMCGCINCDCTGLIARGTHCLTVQGPATSASYRRTLQQRVNDPLVLSFGKASSAGAAAGASQGLGGAPVSFLADKDGLPKSVHLLTLKENGDGRVLLRLAHLYQIDEDSGEDKNVSVDLNKLFQDLSFESALEVTLAAGKPLSKVDRLKWQVGRHMSNDTSADLVVPYVTRSGLSCKNGCQDALKIELQPMEIRTFLLVPKSASAASTLN